MIPIHLRITGFLSYQSYVELDFDQIELACISGNNGAGKSSLLDAITWCLFGEARGKSSDVININPEVKSAEVALTFNHENGVFRVQRTLPRNKGTILEFQIKNGDEWKPLTEKTMRETQSRIESTLRLDYETFVNASFFLQGRADQFTQQNASRRKEILGNILGLGTWEVYKARTADKRKIIERDVDEIDVRISEINAELDEEDDRKSKVNELQTILKRIISQREVQESILENNKKNTVLLEQQRKIVETLSKSRQRSETALSNLENRLESKESERASHLDLVNREKELEADHHEWQTTRKELEKWEKTASQFRENEKDRGPLLEKIAVEKTRLEEEQRSLRIDEESVQDQTASIMILEKEIEKAKKAQFEAKEKTSELADLEQKKNEAKERQAAAAVENETLRVEMIQLKERIEALQSADGATCPLCGQELNEKHRKSTLKQLESEGKEKGDRHRANQKETKELASQISIFEKKIANLSSSQTDQIRYATEVSQLTERVKNLSSLAKDWENTGKKRLKEVDKSIETGKYALEEQKQLNKLDKELAKLGYDAAAHDKVRERESELRGIEERYTALRSAKDVTKQIEGEIESIRKEIFEKRKELVEINVELDTAASTFAELEENSPDIEESERELFRIREEENKVRSELGGAQQRVDILSTQRTRKEEFMKERDLLQKFIVQHKTLERAFGKDGIPALLIEQALPQIEERANDLLDRLSNGQMSIRFVTQAEYKNKKRDDLKETLDIQISDSAGTRNYEMYSGGEAFRVNFAIRLALSEILAQRKGARLQTLVIDEGFGSQDIQGRQRLVEAINLVRNDFAKILVITHLDELKDAFPSRIEVEKTENGSTLRVI